MSDEEKRETARKYCAWALKSNVTSVAALTIIDLTEAASKIGALTSWNRLADSMSSRPAGSAAMAAAAPARTLTARAFAPLYHEIFNETDKQRVFDDVIAVAEHLIETEVTTPAQLAVHGRSNGGLLVGAAMTQRPDLFAGQRLEHLLAQHLFARLAVERQRAETRQTVVSRLSEWQKQPGFKDHEPQIAAKQAELVSRGMDTWSALGLAYSTVVVPTLKAQQATQFVQDAVKKAHASTNNPAVTAPIVKARPRSFGEAFAQLRKAQ